MGEPFHDVAHVPASSVAQSHADTYGSRTASGTAGGLRVAPPALVAGVTAAGAGEVVLEVVLEMVLGGASVACVVTELSGSDVPPESQPDAERAGDSPRRARSDPAQECPPVQCWTVAQRRVVFGPVDAGTPGLHSSERDLFS